MSIVGGSGSGKTNSLFNLMIHHADIDKIYLYAKDPSKAKYDVLIRKGEDVGTKCLNDSKALTEYSNDMQDVYKIIEEYNPGEKRKVLIIFDDMIADMHNNKKLNSIITNLFIRCRKPNICLVFITRSYFKVPKNVRLLHIFFIVNIQKTREL